MAPKKPLLPTRNQAMTDLNSKICGFNGFNIALATLKEGFKEKKQQNRARAPQWRTGLVHRRRANQVRAGPHRAPRDCALGMRALHTQPWGWAASRARGTHSVRLCQGSQTPLLQQLLSLLSPNALPCGQAALQRSSTRSRASIRLLCPSLRRSGTPRLTSCCVATPKLDVCSSIMRHRQQRGLAGSAVSRVQSVASATPNLLVVPVAHGHRCPPSTP